MLKINIKGYNFKIGIEYKKEGVYNHEIFEEERYS